MNKISNLSALLLLFILLIVSSCVSTKKYDALVSEKYQLTRENLNLKSYKDLTSSLKAENASLEKQLEQSQDLLKSLNAKFNGISTNYDDLQKEFQALSAQKSAILNSTAGEKSALEARLAAKQDELDRKQQALIEQERNIAQQQNKVDELSQAMAVREQQIAELNANLEQQRTALSNIRQQITDALSGFNAEELQVVQKPDGKVYVSLSQNLLFKKGSDQVDEKGTEAIIALASVLKDQADIDILVEGHTDSDGTSVRNWELSVDRATEVVKILQTGGVEPQRLVASGRAFYLPVAENDTEENKAKNRRTEIILSPKLDQLYQLIQKE